ncbi:MAG TPA: hypothetical protein VLY04_17315 [Bryobacteraceae bacterium]|nr:hypothetical protein [Bryobacteraceae bacterium]
MRPLTGDLLIEAWERGAGRDALGRALLMLGCGCPDYTAEEIAGWDIFERDQALLRLRRTSFGESLRGYLPCPSCAESLEFEIPVASVLERLEEAKPVGTAAWQIGKFMFSLRPVNSRDLRAAMVAPELAAAQRTLIERCASVRPVEEREAPGPSVWDFEEVVTEQFEQMHRDSEIVLTLPCPACGAAERADFDIGHFLWCEVKRAAAALLRDVHELARAYGWAEKAILEMSGVRRSAYLEMARA